MVPFYSIEYTQEFPVAKDVNYLNECVINFNIRVALCCGEPISSGKFRFSSFSLVGVFLFSSIFAPMLTREIRYRIKRKIRKEQWKVSHDYITRLFLDSILIIEMNRKFIIKFFARVYLTCFFFSSMEERIEYAASSRSTYQLLLIYQLREFSVLFGTRPSFY